MAVAALVLATGPLAQGQVLFDENFNYTPDPDGSFPGTIDASWTLVGNSPHFANDTDGAHEFITETGNGLMSNFQGTTGTISKDLSGGTYNLSNLTGTQVVRASWDAVNPSTSRSSSTEMRIYDSNGSFVAGGNVVHNGGNGRNMGLFVSAAGGGTDYIDLNSDIPPNPRTASCNSSATTGCAGWYVEAYMEITASTVRAAARMRLIEPPQGNVTDRGLVISSNLLTHSLTNVRTVQAETNAGVGEFGANADNYEVIVGNSLIPEPATLSLLGLGALLLMRRRR
jgi:hypothetical protein